MILLMTSNLAWETTLLCVCSKWGLWAAPFYSVPMGKIDEQWWTYQTNPFWIIINPSFFLGETIENPWFFSSTFRPRDPKKSAEEPSICGSEPGRVAVGCWFPSFCSQKQPLPMNFWYNLQVKMMMMTMMMMTMTMMMMTMMMMNLWSTDSL